MHYCETARWARLDQQPRRRESVSHSPGIGQVMTQAATVVRHNKTLQEAFGMVHELQDRAAPLLAFRHRQLDESERRLHQGPARHVPAGQDDSAGRAAARRMPRCAFQARFRDAGHRQPPIRPSSAARPRHGATGSKPTRANGSNRRSPCWIADGEPQLSYEEIDTSLIPPRPRLYGLVGAEMIEQVWKERQATGTTLEQRRARNGIRTQSRQ